MPRFGPKRTKTYRKRGTRKNSRVSAYRKRRINRSRVSAGATHIARNLLPKSKLVKMRYGVTTNLGHGGSGVVGYHVFQANSLYDPDTTGVGTQPIMRDQWANLYQNYVVVGAKIKITFATQSTSVTTQNSFVGIRLNDSSTLSDTDPANLAMHPRQKWTFLGTADGGRPMRTLTYGFSHKKFFKYKDLKDNIDDYKHSFTDVSVEPTGSDGRVPYFVMWTAPMQAAETPTSINTFVQIEYAVLLLDPVDQVTHS